MNISFHKYQGTGNDFVVIDNRTRAFDTLTSEQVQFLCDRRFGVGGDGLMLLNTTAGYDFEMKYYNSDGAESSMCGNGGRCLVKFAAEMGMKKSNYHFKAIDGLHEASIEDNGWVRLKMNNVTSVTKTHSDHVLDTGSPHYVKIVADVEKMDVNKEGRAIRNSSAYKKHGINVNFVEIKDGYIFVRTYERGVENETLSCGTGVTAAALVCAHNDIGFNHIDIKTPGGDLAVEFKKQSAEMFTDIWLCGPAQFVFKGEVDIN